MHSSSLVITDPQTAPTYGDGPISRWCQNHLVEPRDEVFVRLTLRAVAVQLAAMSAVWLAIHFAPIPAWIPMAAYFAFWGWVTPPVILMLHCTMHRSFTRIKWLDKAHPILMSILFGMPTAYREHHTGMHHVEDNMGEDLSSTLRYRRDSFAHFLLYFCRFFFLIGFELPRYLRRRNRHKLARRALVGELAQDGLVAVSLVLDWRFGLVAFALPWFTCRLMMMIGNWGQHAFINVAQKNNGFSNAITCINTGYNERCFNDGYHSGHHLRANRHWTEAPADFLANKDKYAQEGAIVFEGLDFFLVSVLLWTGQYKTLAKRFVRLGAPMTDDDVILLLKERVKPVRVWTAENFELQEPA
jgi:fatty acid desaturase